MKSKFERYDFNCFLVQNLENKDKVNLFINRIEKIDIKDRKPIFGTF